MPKSKIKGALFEHETNALLRYEPYLVLFLALFLVVFASREAIVGIVLAPDAEAIDDIREQRPVAPQALHSLISAEKTAVAIGDHASDWATMGVAYALLPPTTDEAEHQANMQAAEDATIQSLLRAPANPNGWIRLTIIEQALDKPTVNILRDWRMAYVTGPNEDDIRANRIRLGALLWSNLTADDKANLFADIRGLWVYDKDTLLSVAADNLTRGVIRAALVTDVPVFLNFEKALREHPNIK